MIDLDGQTDNIYNPNTTKDKLQITWFNVSRNEDLIPGKAVVNRIYILWDEKDDVYDADEVTEFNADISLSVNGSVQTKNNYTIKRLSPVAWQHINLIGKYEFNPFMVQSSRDFKVDDVWIIDNTHKPEIDLTINSLLLILIPQQITKEYLYFNNFKRLYF